MRNRKLAARNSKSSEKLRQLHSVTILDEELLKMVREVSEDRMYDTIEFNEFLQMMSKQQRRGLSHDTLREAFKIFDKDDDGLISVEELRKIMKNLGDKMADEELDEMLCVADTKHDGFIDYEGRIEFSKKECNFFISFRIRQFTIKGCQKD